MNDASQTRREDARRESLRFLATRHTLAHSLDAIRRGVNREGFDFSTAEIDSAVSVLLGLNLATVRVEKLGSTKYYQATSQGVLEYERA